MTLHQTVNLAKKVFIGLALGLAAIIILVILYRVGIIIKNLLFPPKILAENHIYGTLPVLAFPQNVTGEQLQYSLNTVTGELPDFPTRLNIYPITQSVPNLLNLNKAKDKVRNLGFIGEGGVTLPETALDDINYQWTETEGIKRKIVFNTISFNFILRSNYASSLTVLNAERIENEKIAPSTVSLFLSSIGLLPKDVDKNKTKTNLFAITNGTLSPTTSLSKTQIIRLDLYQKDIAYELNTGIPEVTGGYKIEKISLPVMYPRPPYSTMNFLIGAGITGQQVVAADFIHQPIESDITEEATYLIKTASEAYEELKNGKAYIASYSGPATNISITKVYLAYYVGETNQSYLMPIIVFEGENGFIAYVSAVRPEWAK